MPRPTRRLTPDEIALWHHVTRAVAPLRADGAAHAPQPPASSTVAAPSPPPAASTVAARAGRPASIPRAPTPPPASSPPLPARISRRLDPHRPVDLDRRTWLKLRRGLHPIEARLDLHGLTQDQAHDRLAAFLRAAHARGNRCVLVITGRGARSGGTLRAMTPRWLDEAPVRPLVLAFTEARLEHGGEGALYVLLRRKG